MKNFLRSLNAEHLFIAFALISVLGLLLLW